jgi:hypothetical protein
MHLLGNDWIHGLGTQKSCSVLFCRLCTAPKNGKDKLVQMEKWQRKVKCKWKKGN